MVVARCFRHRANFRVPFGRVNSIPAWRKWNMLSLFDVQLLPGKEQKGIKMPGLYAHEPEPVHGPRPEREMELDIRPRVRQLDCWLRQPLRRGCCSGVSVPPTPSRTLTRLKRSHMLINLYKTYTVVSVPPTIRIVLHAWDHDGHLCAVLVPVWGLSWDLHRGYGESRCQLFFRLVHVAADFACDAWQKHSGAVSECPGGRELALVFQTHSGGD